MEGLFALAHCFSGVRIVDVVDRIIKMSSNMEL
jgi:hypothetical protein